jgi:CheY-like chemotaxis protein
MSFPKRPSKPPGPVVAGGSRPPRSLSDAAAEAHAIAGGIVRPSAAPSSMNARKTVMLVDDDAAARGRLKALLEPHYTVVEAKDGMEAVELLGTIAPPNMVVTDVVMPRLDGFSFAKILRGNPLLRRIPVLFVSSRNSPTDVTQAISLGAVQYITKTTPVSEIVSKIRKILL